LKEAKGELSSYDTISAKGMVCMTIQNADELKAIYFIAAKVVAQHGEKYLPVFNRLHEEIKRLEKEQDIKSIALQVAIR